MDLKKSAEANTNLLGNLLQAAKDLPLSVAKADLDRMTGRLDYEAATFSALQALENLDNEREMLRRIVGGIAGQAESMRVLQMAAEQSEHQKMIERVTGSGLSHAITASTERYLIDIVSQQEILGRFTGIAKNPVYLDAIKDLSSYSVSREVMNSLEGVPSIADMAQNYLAQASGAQRHADALNDMLKATSLGSYTEKIFGQISGSSISSLVAEDYSKLLRASHLSQVTREFERHAAYAARPALVHMEHLLQTSDPYSVNTAEAFRRTLGDWRQPVLGVEGSGSTIEVKQIYVEQGFDQGLSQTPDEIAFEEIRDAGLDSSTLAYQLMGPIVQQLPEAMRTGLQRSTACFQLIVIVESRLRVFIRESLQAKHGDHWMKRGLPSDVRRSVEELKVKNGDETNADDLQHLDFSHYEKIILKSDNWKEVFSSRLSARREADVRESLNRLMFIRNRTMHSKNVSMEDVLTTTVEVRRLLLAIGASRLH